MEGNKITFLVLLYFVGGIKNCDSETAICNPIAYKTSRCSTNVDCECLSFTSNPTIGVCAALLLSCTSVARCNSERTCPIENTICVNNTRCQYPVCYPLALADKQICPSSVTTMTPATTTADLIDTPCPVDQTSSITAEANQQINFNTKFPSCPLCVTVSIDANGGIYNVCSIRQLNIAANGNGAVTVQRSSICPTIVNISTNGNARVYNACSSQQLNVAANGNGAVIMQQSYVCPSYVNLTINANGAVYNVCSAQYLNITANGNGAVTMQQSSVCPKFVNISAGGNARVYNICVSDHLTVLSATGNNIISMDYKQISSCPKVVDILNGSGNSVFYVCATQAINAKLSGIAKLYYKGPLNHTEITSLASTQQWI